MRFALRATLFLVGLALLALIPITVVRHVRALQIGHGEGTRIGFQVPSLEGGLTGLYMRLLRINPDQPLDENAPFVSFVVEPGETATSIGARLVEQGLIADAQAFRLVVRQMGVEHELEAGEFRLSASMTMREIVQALQHGQLPFVIVTILEGWRAEEVAAYLTDQLQIDPNEFMSLVRSGRSPPGSGLSFDYDFLRDLPPDYSSLEGYLFPETYQVPTEFTAADMIDLMLRTFDERFTPEMRERAKEMGMTIHEVVTLASIVEREAVVSVERPTIASVFHNRIATGMRLDADPTVQYALGYQEGQGWWKKPILFVDLDVQSPYNTYRRVGLPPGPICSVGEASLRAVLWPDDTDYLFFVANTVAADGSHVFAETYDEHLENQRKYQK